MCDLLSINNSKRSKMCFYLNQMKKCPNPECSFEYGRRKLIHICPKCKAMLGPKTVSEVPKVAKKEKAKKVTHPTVEIEPGIYSVQYHQHNR